MSKQLEKFKKELLPLEKAAEKCQEEYKAHATNREHHKQMMMESAKEIGREVQTLKNNGATGDKLADFITAKELKPILKTVATANAALNKEEARLTQILASANSTQKGLDDLNKKVEKEIGSRQKKATRKVLPKTSKSLSEMEDLPAFIRQISQGLTDEIITMEKVLKWTADKEYKGFEKICDIEIKMIKADRKGRDTQEKDGRAFDLRLVGGAHNKIKLLADETKKLCVDALKQTKAGDKDAAKKALDEAYEKLKDIAKLKATYDRSFKGMKEHDLKSMKESSDGKKVLAAYISMGNLEKDAKKAVVGTARKSI